jgi:hypothetical protein
MTEYKLKVPGQLLSSLMNDKNALAGLLEEVLNQVLDVQAEDQSGAGRYERSEERTDYKCVNVNDQTRPGLSHNQ